MGDVNDGIVYDNFVPIDWMDFLMPVEHQPTLDYVFPECDGDIIQVVDLHFSYPDGHVALKGVSINLCEGDKVAIVGPNGAGKSTLMLHLNGILEGKGDISVAGMNLSKKNMHIIRIEDEALIDAILNGRHISLTNVKTAHDEIMLMNSQEKILCIGKIEGDIVHPKIVFNKREVY